MNIWFLLISFLASVAGAICGIGGGVVIKPVMDVLGLASIPTISFLSGCTVLTMSLYSVGGALLQKQSYVRPRTATPLAIGAALGGVIGSQLFLYIEALFPDPNRVGAVQAACLGLFTIATLLYTLRKAGIRTHTLQSIPLCLIIGLALGLASSFLGIGGGPINLVVLYFFFSMPTKAAAQNSLYIILFSQLASLLSTILRGAIPPFAPSALLLMVVGGLLGGISGRALQHHMAEKTVERLFIALMGLIILICALNTLRYW